MLGVLEEKRFKVKRSQWLIMGISNVIGIIQILWRVGGVKVGPAPDQYFFSSWYQRTSDYLLFLHILYLYFWRVQINITSYYKCYNKLFCLRNTVLQSVYLGWNSDFWNLKSVIYLGTGRREWVETYIVEITNLVTHCN